MMGVKAFDSTMGTSYRCDRRITRTVICLSSKEYNKEGRKIERRVVKRDDFDCLLPTNETFPSSPSFPERDFLFTCLFTGLNLMT